MEDTSTQNSDRPVKKTPVSWLTGNTGSYMSLGIQAGVAVAFYLGVGLLLDKWLNTLPWLTLLGAIVGIVAMFSLFFRVSKELNKTSDEGRVSSDEKASDEGRLSNGEKTSNEGRLSNDER